jgi:Spy/CpxP family protein refolding chaperone
MKSSVLLSLFAAGTLFTAVAQPIGQPTGQPQGPPQGQAPAQSKDQPQTANSHRRMIGGPMVHRLTRELNLSPDQQTQARTIFEQARQQAQSLNPKLKDERQALSAAIKSDNESQIDQITRQDAQVNSRARAIHAKAMAKFYSILTTDQKAKFDQVGANWRAGARGRRQAG